MKKFAPILVALALSALASCSLWAETTTDTSTSTTTTTPPAPAPASAPAPAMTTPPPMPAAPTVKVDATVDAKASMTPAILEISMESGNLYFKPSKLTAKVNQPVKINFKNTGSHTFTIDELNVNLALNGDSGSVSFTPAKTGTFQYYCAVPGHKQGGMYGTLTVQ